MTSLLALHSCSFLFLQFAAPELPSFAPGCCPCGRIPVLRNFATPSRQGRARELPTSRFVTSRAVKHGMREPFRMTTESAAQGDDLAAFSHIMEPIHEGGKDLLLVHCPGALKASEKYFALMHEIQAQSSLRLWIVVLHNTDQEALSTSKVDATLTGVLAKLKQHGFRLGSIDIERLLSWTQGHQNGDVQVPRALKTRTFKCSDGF